MSNNLVIRPNNQKKQFFQVVGFSCELPLLPKHRQKFSMAARFRLEPLFGATAGMSQLLIPHVTRHLYDTFCLCSVPSASTKAPPPVLLPRGAEKMMPLAVTFLLGNLSVDQFPICLMWYLQGEWPSLNGKVKCNVGGDSQERHESGKETEKEIIAPSPPECWMNPEILKQVSGSMTIAFQHRRLLSQAPRAHQQAPCIYSLDK